MGRSILLRRVYALFLAVAPILVTGPVADVPMTPDGPSSVDEAIPDVLSVEDMDQIRRLMETNRHASQPLNGSVVQEDTKITANDAANFDGFGFAVAISGNVIVVGAPFDDDPFQGSAVGAVYVFLRNGSTWSLQTKLAGSDTGGGDQFGSSVAIAGDLIIVGARLHDHLGDSDRGGAYVFVRSGAAWYQQAELAAGDGSPGDFFGASAALSGETAVIGAQRDSFSNDSRAGSAYVFVRNGSTWSQQAKLIASDADDNDQLGVSVSIDTDTILVGSFLDDTVAGNSAGSAYVFARSGTSWSEQAKLTANDAAGGDWFGTSVAIQDDTAIVGASRDDNFPHSDIGSAYVFLREGTSWSQQAKLTPDDGQAADQFGAQVALLGDTALVGARLADHSAGEEAGSAYVFLRSEAGWGQTAKLTASDAGEDDLFGSSVALSNGTIVIGAQSADHSGLTKPGAVYVFDNEAPVAVCTDVAAVVDEVCAVNASIDAGSFDPDGDSFTLSQNPVGPYDLGNNVVTLTVTDALGAEDSCDATVSLEDSPTLPDADGDTTSDVCDNCPVQANVDQSDTDGDGSGDVCDNCPDDSNAQQTDSDNDGVGNVCDDDDDDDGLPDDSDNCPLESNADQSDRDADQSGDACDNCPDTANTDQGDFDGDDLGDACDSCRFDASNVDTDEDGFCDDGDASGVVGDDTCPASGGGPGIDVTHVAIFEDRSPWGQTINQQILTANGIPFSVFGSDQMGFVDLSSFDKVVIASQQPADFYIAVSVTAEWFDAYVLDGGILEFHGASWFSDDWSDLSPMPAGLQIAPQNNTNAHDFLTIVDTANPLVNVPNLISDSQIGNQLANSYFTSADESLATIIEEDEFGQPVLVEFGLGQGCVIASMMALEFLASEPAILENLLLRGCTGTACDDNCVATPNDQTNSDQDSLGDACDNCPGATNEDQADVEADGYGDACDNCPLIENADQADADGDLVGDVCDNCLTNANSDQANADGDAPGDACDNCPGVGNNDQADLDADNVGDPCDNCPATANTDQADMVHPNGIGDACDDPDDDGAADSVDNCVDAFNPLQADDDIDGSGDVCDICPAVSNPDQNNPVGCLDFIEDGGQCLEATVELVSPDIDGELLVLEASKVIPESITFEALAISCSGISRFGSLQIRLNGAYLGSVPLDPFVTCSCTAQSWTRTFDDPSVLAGWNLDGTNLFRLEQFDHYSGASALAWVRATLEAQEVSETVCLFDYGGGTCDDPNVCSAGFNFVEVTTEVEIDSQIDGASPFVTVPFVGSQLPGLIDIAGMSDGSGEVCVVSGGEQDCAAVTKQGEEDLAINGAPCGPPVADAGMDITAECGSPAGATITLDGSGSSDPNSTPGTNDDIVLFEWFEDFGGPAETALGTGETLSLGLALGGHEITLRVTDSFDVSDVDTVMVDVVDTTPPVLSGTLSPTELWPPNHRMVDVTASMTATDICGQPTILLSSISSNEPDDAVGNGDGRTVQDIGEADYGTTDFTFALRAERAGGGSGRIYTVNYTAIDAGGSSTGWEGTVVVPHDQGGVVDPVDISVEGTSTGARLKWSEVPDALHYKVIRGRVSDIVETPDAFGLGVVVCVPPRIPSGSEIEVEDAGLPAAGETLFYLVEYVDDAPSSYGSESAAKPRLPGAGACD